MTIHQLKLHKDAKKKPPRESVHSLEKLADMKFAQQAALIINELGSVYRRLGTDDHWRTYANYSNKKKRVVKEIINAALNRVRSSTAKTLPRSMGYRGATYELEYSSFGRVFICDHRGTHAIASSFFVL